MTAIPHPAGIREDLADLLQEADPHRALDSLETVVVLTYLHQHRLQPPMPPQERPTTIEGWVTWADRQSPDS